MSEVTPTYRRNTTRKLANTISQRITINLTIIVKSCSISSKIIIIEPAYC